MFLKSAIYSRKSFRDDNALQCGAAMSTLASNRLKEVLRSVVPYYEITIPGSSLICIHPAAECISPQSRLETPDSALGMHVSTPYKPVSTCACFYHKHTRLPSSQSLLRFATRLHHAIFVYNSASIRTRCLDASRRL
jgi:hypothetical protein